MWWSLQCATCKSSEGEPFPPLSLLLLQVLWEPEATSSSCDHSLMHIHLLRRLLGCMETWCIGMLAALGVVLSVMGTSSAVLRIVESSR